MNTVEKATVYFKRAGTENTLTLLETLRNT